MSTTKSRTPKGTTSSSSTTSASGGGGVNSKVTADSYGSLNVTEADKECWMLKIPPKLAEAFQDAPEGTILGELVFKKGGATTSTSTSTGAPGSTTEKIRPSFEVHVDPSLDKTMMGNSSSTSTSHMSTALPLQYSLQAMTKKIPTLHPFTRHPNGSVQIHGTVTRTANLQVHQDANYRALLKSRLLATTVHNTRFVRPVESNQVVQQTVRVGGSGGGGGSNAATAVGRGTKPGGFGDAVHQFGKRMLEAQQNSTANYLSGNKGGVKRARFTADEPIRSVIFQLYEDKLFWATKDLRAASGGRPETEIKKVLQEIAIYHRSGEQKNTWELKKEYQSGKHQQLSQQQQQQQQSGGGSGAGNGNGGGAGSGSGEGSPNSDGGGK
jgi:hypothetical protein